MNVREAQEHARENIVPAPFATIRNGLPCVGTHWIPGWDREVAIVAATFEAAFEQFGQVCPPAYLPVPVSAYARTCWRDRLAAHVSFARANE
jgi:hypothetical protein